MTFLYGSFTHRKHKIVFNLKSIEISEVGQNHNYYLDNKHSHMTPDGSCIT